MKGGPSRITVKKSFETMVTMACMKPMLMFFNVSFGMSGVTMLVSAIWIRIRSRNYADMSTDAGGAALLGLAFLGALVILTSTLACCCTARGHPALLYLYGAFLACVTLLELCVGASVYTYRAAVTKGFDQNLNESFTFYGDDKIITRRIDMMQSTLHCCGSRTYSDWLDLKPVKDIPKSCCKSEEKCDVNEVSDIYTEGCYNRVIDFISSNVGLVAACAMGVATFPLLGVFLSCCLASHINKARYEQVA